MRGGITVLGHQRGTTGGTTHLLAMTQIVVRRGIRQREGEGKKSAEGADVEGCIGRNLCQAVERAVLLLLSVELLLLGDLLQVEFLLLEFLLLVLLEFLLLVQLLKSCPP